MGEIGENREADGSFYEIEYDSSPFSGVGKLVLKPQKIEEAAKDEIREQFGRMREIARAERATYDYSRFFDRRVHHDNAIILYKQGIFMKDFVDDYSGNAPFSQYYPHYQMMGYEQLRTYFTWRTQVRKGIVSDISLSYAFLYIYELLGNIGVAGPQDGLDRLMFFWETFSAHNKSIDKYLLSWLKDYHIYYDLQESFKEFVERQGLAGHYPKASDLEDMDDSFDLFCAASKYDIRKSTFFAGGNADLVKGCFGFVMDRIRQAFEAAGMNFDSVFFRPTRRMSKWKPFESALFHPWLQQPDRQVVLSENEIYICRGNEWFFSTIVTSEKGKRFIGYVMKRMEMVLREAMKYKYKITANLDMVHDDTIRSLTKSGLFIESIVSTTVIDFYREITKTVVTVDPSSLARIRQEALVTQEALIVEDQPDGLATAMTALPLLDQEVFTDPAEPWLAPDNLGFDSGASQDVSADPAEPWLAPDNLGNFEPEFVSNSWGSHELTPGSGSLGSLDPAPGSLGSFEPEFVSNSWGSHGPTSGSGSLGSLDPAPDNLGNFEPEFVSNSWGSHELTPGSGSLGSLDPAFSDEWGELRDSFTGNELQALAVILHGGDIKAFADRCGVMLEVLADSINGKAMDCVGDNLMAEFVLYDEYKEQVKEMVG